MFNKVLILSASSGAGHGRAAQAIERAFQSMEMAREVRHIDTLEYTSKLFQKLYSKAYLEMVNKAPDVFGWLYDQTDKPWKNERRRLAFDKLNTRPFVKLLKEYNPDIIVCTHFTPAEIVSWLKAKERLNCKQAIVITDFDVHAMWLNHHYEHYFVALDETKVHLVKLGIPSAKITVSGIPIDPVFMVKKDKRSMRRKFGLLEDRTTILISAGGFGVGPIKKVIESIQELKHSTQVIALCGRNQELKRYIEDNFKEGSKGNAIIKPIGFTTEMDEYMAASDILLGKSGGLTTSEALARGLVFVIINPIPGQEERNSDHLLEQGVAIRCNNLPVLAFKIDRMLDDPSMMSRMKANANRLARPSAAFDIVRKLSEIAM